MMDFINGFLSDIGLSLSTVGGVLGGGLAVVLVILLVVAEDEKRDD